MKEKEIEITFTINERQYNMFKELLQKEHDDNIPVNDIYAKSILSCRAWGSILYCTRNNTYI